MPELNLNLKLLRKQQHWFQIDRVDQKLINRFPSFLIEQADGSCFYGIPEIDYLGMKVCEHSGGTEVSNPTELDRELDQAELELKKIFSQVTRVQLNAGAKSWAKSGKIDTLKQAYTNLFKKENDLLLLLGCMAGLSILYVDKDKTAGCGYL